jgi:ATP-binding cassette subfamily B protein RaxB
VSVQIDAGEFVGIVGPSGSGKSTLLKVVCGLLPAEGEVRVDGRPVHLERSFGGSSLFAAVLQEDRIVAGTVAANVALFDRAIDRRRLWQALRQACVAQDVRALPMQADTYLGDGADVLSGGQRQRLLLARALYAQPRVLLVDESVFVVDETVAVRISESLATLDMTRIVVAPRPQTLVLADRVFRLEGGRLVAQSSSRSVGLYPVAASPHRAAEP